MNAENQARLLDLAGDAILVRSLEGKIVYWNHGAERLYGWSRDEALGRAADEILGQRSEDTAAMTRTLFAQGFWSGDVAHTHRGGASLTVQTRLTLVRDDAGAPESVLAISTDVTTHKKLEAQILRTQRMECIGTLASGIAHDLNNVLTPIMTSCQLLSLPLPDRDRAQMVEILSRSAQRGAELIRQVLAFSRGVESRSTIEMPVQPLLEEVRLIAAQTFPKSIRTEVAIQPGLWPVRGDPTQIHQVLLNLCINARDAMPRGGTLRLTAENAWFGPRPPAPACDGEQRPWLVIGVTDTGTGIPAEIREKIFDPFFTTKEVGKGTGLGLSTSLAIAKSHGGFLTVYSETGRGTAFRFYLPALPVAPDEPPRSAGEAPLGGDQELVLLVDDEAAIREITGRMLEAHGYRVLTAASGAEAVRVQAQHGDAIRVALVDMTMPGMDGPATIHALHRQAPRLPVIATSGLLPETHLSRCPPEAVRAYLPKPYTGEALLTALRRTLDLGAPEPSARS